MSLISAGSISLDSTFNSSSVVTNIILIMEVDIFRYGQRNPFFHTPDELHPIPLSKLNETCVTIKSF